MISPTFYVTVHRPPQTYFIYYFFFLKGSIGSQMPLVLLTLNFQNDVLGLKLANNQKLCLHGDTRRRTNKCTGWNFLSNNEKDLLDLLRSYTGETYPFQRSNLSLADLEPLRPRRTKISVFKFAFCQISGPYFNSLSITHHTVY